MKYLLITLLVAATPAFAQEEDTTLMVRDAIGDLNASSVKSGDLPGFIALPGKNVSIGFGGFIKTIGYRDSHKEQKGEVITPAYFNPADREGQFGMSARLSRFLFEAGASSGIGTIRGYFEVDFTTGGFNIRHAYGKWSHNKNEILAGQYWSAFMDLGALAYAEGTGEPAVNGIIFVRQAQLRFTHKFSPQLKAHISLEDPSSTDLRVPAGFGTYTSRPDLIAAITFSGASWGHLQLAGISRRLRADSADSYNSNKSTLGVSIGSHFNIGPKGKLVASATMGDGIGRYQLGLNGIGSYLDDSKLIQPYKCYGYAFLFQQPINAKWRFNLGYGKAGNRETAKTELAFENSTYANANVFIKLAPFLTVGMEYIYGENQFSSGATGKNHRIQFGIQIF